MPTSTTYPGVYIEEMSSGVRTISGVSTSVAAFVGYTTKEKPPIRLFNFADYERNFDGLASASELSYSVKHFFDNGGGTAVVVSTKSSNANDLIGDSSLYTGLHALKKIDAFNILCIPDATKYDSANAAGSDPNVVFNQAALICEDKRAFLIIDPPTNVNDLDKAIDWKTNDLTVKSKNAAAYFPHVRIPDPLNDYRLRTHPPCGIIAGLYARIDAERGIWKAPAGTEAFLRGVQGMTYKLTDPENGRLNPLGLNCLRQFPSYGSVSWGARTLVGSDVEASEWKYVPVRRLALYIEESLYQGTKWVVFEPNDESLWSQIRLNISAFMQSLFQQGAFAGKSPRDAYEVKCDRSTTTPDDINRGIVNVVVKFAPVRPAEFVVVTIQQLGGQGLV
jgi:uncharacterized protein